MTNKNILLTVIASLSLAGCAVTGEILPVEENGSGFDGAVFSGKSVEFNKPTPGGTEYRVFNQGASGYVSVEANRVEANSRATQFCKDSGGQFRLLRQTTSQPPHIFGNYPRVELVFECTSRNSTFETGNHIQPTASTQGKPSDISKFDYAAREKARSHKCFPATLVHTDKVSMAEDAFVFMCQDGSALTIRCSSSSVCISVPR